MRDALRTCLQIAGGLAEATRRRTAHAARELLDQAGIDVDDLQRKIGERIPPEVQTLTDELIASGRANRDLLTGLIREEVDKTLSRVGRIADEVTKVGVVLEVLERRVRNLEAEEPLQDDAPSEAAPEAAPVADEAGPGAGTDADAGAAAPGRARPARKTVQAEKSAAAGAGAAPPAKKASSSKSVAGKPAVKSGEAAPAGAKTAKAPVKKAAAKKAAAKKATPAATPATAPAKKTAAKKTAAKKTAAKKTAAKKTTAKKTTARPTAKKAAPAAGRTTTGGPDTEAKNE
ncbi:histone [Actinacidiphila oryziradicis]|uniref:Histone n=1 Tax=Actinacidiphila oryziradicis TaxID=2571141 RepID=A0A4U0SHI2_9ACTN|nr:histone [Actinacidiphila oryziradicis]TKA08986.1 histone [Actinacidiphila oryziradicis]